MAVEKKYKGVIVPVITPLTSEYKLDEAAVEKILPHLYENGAQPFILGATGEAASLPIEIKHAYIKKAAGLKRDNVLLFAGISANCMSESVELAKRAFDVGIDAVAATLPSYYMLTESQMMKYFESLADQIKGPLIIYNFPATTQMSIPLEIIDELSHHENIVATKDSERSESRLNLSSLLWSNREDFSHFLGWTAKAAHALLNGSDGIIPSTGNLYPKLYKEMIRAISEADQEQVYHYQYHSDLISDLYQLDRTFGESLWALKVLMNELGLCEPNVMPPLQGSTKVEEVRIKQAFHELIEKENIPVIRPS